jgi:hypothetical protein
MCTRLTSLLLLLLLLAAATCSMPITKIQGQSVVSSQVVP